MKVIFWGQPQPAEPPRWWVGQQAKCPICHVTVEFECHDPVYSVVDSNGRTAQMACFTLNCRGMINCKDEGYAQS